MHSGRRVGDAGSGAGAHLTSMDHSNCKQRRNVSGFSACRPRAKGVRFRFLFLSSLSFLGLLLPCGSMCLSLLFFCVLRLRAPPPSSASASPVGGPLVGGKVSGVSWAFFRVFAGLLLVSSMSRPWLAVGSIISPRSSSGPRFREGPASLGFSAVVR